MEEQAPQVFIKDSSSSKKQKLQAIKVYHAKLPDDSVRRPVLQCAVNYGSVAFFRWVNPPAEKKYVAFNGIVKAAYDVNLSNREFLNRAQQSIAEMGFWSTSYLRANTLPIIDQQRARCASRIEHSELERAVFGAYWSLISLGATMFALTEQKFWLIFPVVMCLLLKFWKSVPKDMPIEECPSWMGLILYNYPGIAKTADFAGRVFGPLRIFDRALDWAERGTSIALLKAGEKLTASVQYKKSN